MKGGALGAIHALPFLALAVLAGCRDDGTGPPIEEPLAALTVMSRNVYLGGDIGAVLAADFTNPVAVVQAAATVWGQVQASGFAERAGAIVDEIEEAEPHVVGLQEVARFVVLDAGFTPVSEIDYLSILESEIQAQGLPYSTVSVQENTQVTLPVAVDPTTGQVTQYIQFTDRIALMARSDFTVSGTASANYAAEAPVVDGVTLRRGWIRTSFLHEGTAYTLVNTHLETQGLAPVQAEQTAELLASVLGSAGGIEILIGDLNSDAAADPGAPSWTATYGALVDAGFADAWVEASGGSGDPGFTCCQSPGLDDAGPVFDERIDFVLVRDGAAPGRISGTVEVEIVGDEVGDHASSGLWPSDHAGLVMDLTPPSP